MRKFSIVVALLLLLALALVACGGDEAAEPAADVADEETAGVTEEEQAEPEEQETEGEEAEETTEGDCASEEVFCVGLVTDVGEIDDKSFNQSAWEGVERAQDEMGAQIDFIETKDAKDYAANIDLFAENGYDAIVTVGFALGQATIEAAQRYPEVDFIGVDQFQAPEAPEGWEGEWPMPNVVGIIFPEDQAGYLAGVLAAELSETGTIAAVLGTDLVPPVVAFKEGYEAGALATNPEINIIATYHPGGLDVAFTDPEWGASTAAQAIDQGADVVFGAGGKTGNGALIEVASHEGVYCIGVDTDQWETVPEAHPCLVTSAMKLITPAVAEMLEASAADNLPTGNFVGDVGLAPYHDFADEIPEDTKQLIEATEQGLASGDISTGYAP